MYCMKCTGYDSEWQKFLLDCYPQFEKEQITRKEEREAKKRMKAHGRTESSSKKGRNTRQGARSKRRAKDMVDRSDSGSESAGGESVVDLTLRDSEDESPNEEVVVVNMSRGTRSRPKVARRP